MGKYLIKRILHSILSVIAVVALVMILVYSLLNRELLFKADGTFAKTTKNQRTEYMYSKWEEYGYLDFVTFADYLKELTLKGEIDEETRAAAVSIGRTADKDSELTAQYVKQFTEYYESQGYTIHRLDAIMASKYGSGLAAGGEQKLFAERDIPLVQRMVKYFTGLIEVDNIHKATGDVGERGLTFTLHDPAYGGKFSPAILGNGTRHKYLLYMDGKFPFIHQNMAILRMGTSYTVNNGVDVFDTMSRSQGAYVLSEVTYPTGFTEQSADDLHSAIYREGSRESNPINEVRFDDDYTNVVVVRGAPSKLGFSFIIGIIATILAYVIGVPMGVAMARKKDGLLDKIGTVYIVFIIAVPSLAYIFLFKAFGGKLGLPTLFDMESGSKMMYVLPIVSLALPSIANTMKWLRRYMIDQMNSDYVKFARSGGLTENEIFTKHILKNAAIPIVHGIPGSIIFAMTGAIITERVYVVPGTGNLLTEAINKYDNGVIVGVTLFYAVLSVTSIILGDVLMAAVDPRISLYIKGEVTGMERENAYKDLGLSEEELFSLVSHDELESEKITAPRYSYWSSVFRVFFRKKINIVILVLLGIVILMAYVYPAVVEYDPFVNLMDAEAKHLTPANAIDKFGFSLKYILGTGASGEYTFEAIWNGSRISLSLAFLCAAINMTVGVIVGAIWGFSKKVDAVMMEVYNIIGNVPFILFVSVMVMLFTPSFMTLVFAMTITGWLGIAYSLRIQVIIIRDREYNLASRCLGTSTVKIAMKNILPFMTSFIVTLLATEIPSYIGSEVFLSYIGLGMSERSLGRMIYESQSAMVTPGWEFEFWSPVAISAVITIVLYVVGQNLGDASDPRTHM